VLTAYVDVTLGSGVVVILFSGWVVAQPLIRMITTKPMMNTIK
jgi:hypothetical protein